MARSKRAVVERDETVEAYVDAAKAERDRIGEPLNGAVVDETELSWFFGAAAADLGEASSFEAMVAQMQLGSRPSAETWDQIPWMAPGKRSLPFRAPSFPNDRQTAAARRQVEVRRALRRLPLPAQALLELAFSDRRQPQVAVTAFGRGTACIVTRALGQRRASHIATAGTKSEQAAARQAAEQLLGWAVDLYRAARDDERSERPRRPRRDRSRNLVPAGVTGATVRRLVEAPRRVWDRRSDDEDRAA